MAGRTRTGKTLSTRNQVSRVENLLVLDPKREWILHAGCKEFSDAEIIEAVEAAREPGRISYVPASIKAFEWWASAAFIWARLCPGLTVIAEEVSAYTSPAKAPPGWHRLLSQGLGYGTNVWAVMQRPAEGDKTCFGNASRIRCFALSRALDRAYMARELDCDPSRIAKLRKFEYLERDMESGKIELRRCLAARQT